MAEWQFLYLGKGCAGRMGIYLNGKKAYGLFQEDASLTYYVDKTDILEELVPILEQKKLELTKQNPTRERASNISALPGRAVSERR